MPRRVAIEWTEETQKNLRGLGAIMATTKECAAFFEVSEPTFIAFLNRNPEAREILADGQGQKRLSLRRQQFKLAESGNVAMLIWLGKQYLDQVEPKQAHEHSGPNGAPIQTVDLTDVDDGDLDRIEAILTRAGAVARGARGDAGEGSGGEEPS